MRNIFLDFVKIGKSQVCLLVSMFKQSLVEVVWDLLWESRAGFFLLKAFLERTLYSHVALYSLGLKIYFS